MPTEERTIELEATVKKLQRQIARHRTVVTETEAARQERKDMHQVISQQRIEIHRLLKLRKADEVEIRSLRKETLNLQERLKYT